MAGYFNAGSGMPATDFSSGAGRFMQGGLPSMPATPTTPGPESATQAFQPNYSLFYNPREMLGAGQPSFQDPMWYQSTTAAPPPAPTGPDMSSLYSPWWSGQMPRSPGVNVMAMDPRERVLYLNSLVNPAQFQALGGYEQMGGGSMLSSPTAYQRRQLPGRRIYDRE